MLNAKCETRQINGKDTKDFFLIILLYIQIILKQILFHLLRKRGGKQKNTNYLNVYNVLVLVKKWANFTI